MSNYRRTFIKGGVYFFTVVTHQRQPLLCSPDALHRLKKSFHHVKTNHPFKIKGLVVLPDHLHCIWQLPPHDDNFSLRWNLIKRYFSLNFECPTNHRREKTIWQKRFWEHAVRNADDFARCLDYIHYNPVKHGYVKNPADWSHSTFRQYLERGYYDLNWGNEQQLESNSQFIFE